MREDKPTAAVDACWIGDQEVTDQQTCRTAYPDYGSTRMAAGGPLADNIEKCQLRPLDPADYNVTFTAAEWATLQQTFSTGDATGPSRRWIRNRRSPG